MIKSISLALFLAAPASLNMAHAAVKPTVHKGVMVLEANQIQAEGQADYRIESSGRLLVKGYADAPALHMKGLKFDQTYHVAPENLLSSQYQKVGNTIDFDKVKLKVTAVDKNRKLSTAGGTNAKGEVTFVFDTSKKMIDLQRISVTSRTMPIPLSMKRAG
ncbi:MAG TPA: hypothetical protein VE954_15200 [Oligoflexus sp.]|uniref:hypothetical protein n=1 Tax=Oligoflexus sp. TaxID=1971216 RepID=UPI002D39BFCE|nr:hypothetical protein [Oligoflexus sp.]HYX34450.1 hypothetical protein [Oligoflexus sp.]